MLPATQTTKTHTDPLNCNNNKYFMCVQNVRETFDERNDVEFDGKCYA